MRKKKVERRRNIGACVLGELRRKETGRRVRPKWKRTQLTYGALNGRVKVNYGAGPRDWVKAFQDRKNATRCLKSKQLEGRGRKRVKDVFSSAR